MAEINIIKVDGKPLEKLIEVISKGVGTIYKPRAIRKEAEAKAYEIEIIERAKSKALAEGKEIEADIIDRIQERVLYKETKRQQNIDNISQIAAEQLSQETSVSNEPVDEDWTTRFFNIAQDISSEEMQALWGRILAGEIKQPKSYSLRTLEVLRNLNKSEAECFIKFGQLSIIASGSAFILNFQSEKLLQEKYDLHFGERLLLEELGLITANDLQFEMQETKEQERKIAFAIGDTCVVVKREKNIGKQGINILAFTKIGQELLQLIEIKPELDYIQLLASKIRRKGVTVTYGKILEIKDNEIYHAGLIDVPLTEEEIKKEEERLKQEKERQQREEERKRKIEERKNKAV